MSMYNVVFYCCLCLIRHTSGQDNFDTEPYILCEDQDSPSIVCPTATLIKIKDAIYGRTDGSACTDGDIKSTSCIMTVTTRVEQMCNSKQRCLPKASNDIYGDPCERIYKYLNVTYRCIKDAQPSLKPSTHLPTQFSGTSSSTKSERQVSFPETGLVAGIVAGIGIIILIIAIFIFKRFSVFCFARKVPYAIKHDEQDQTDIQNVAYINSNTSGIEGNNIIYITLGNETDDHNYTELRNSPLNKIENHTIESDSYLNVCKYFERNRQSSATDSTYEEVRQKGSTQIFRQTRETHHDYAEFTTNITT